MSQRRLGVAVAQVGAVHVSDSRQRTLGRLIALLQEAKSRGADFVVFPELTLATFFPRYWMSQQEAQELYFEHAMPNPKVQALFDEARRLEVGFYLGYAELCPQDGAFNTSILVNKKGQIIGKYRKVHLPGHSDHKPDAPFQHLEKKYFQVGNDTFKVWELDEVQMGMCLCNDRRWPETWRVMGLQGAEFVALGYNTPSINIHWPEPVHLRMHHHLITLQASAYQNAVWIGAAAKCGVEDGHHMIGGSVIVAPTGEIVAQASTEEDELIYFNADLNLGQPFRDHVFNFAKHRRPEHYQLIVERTGVGAPLA